MGRINSKAKGNRFELDTCKALSRWMTRGDRTDLFARNVISGGSFTKAQKDGQIAGLPGDIMANHPDAFRFLKLFAVECKHKASLQLEQFFFDAAKQSFLWKTYLGTEAQAAKLGMWPMVIAKQNRRETIMLVPWLVAERALLTKRKRIDLLHHQLHNAQMGMFYLDNFLMAVDPHAFMGQMAPPQKE